MKATDRLYLLCTIPLLVASMPDMRYIYGERRHKEFLSQGSVGPAEMKINPDSTETENYDEMLPRFHRIVKRTEDSQPVDRNPFRAQGRDKERITTSLERGIFYPHTEVERQSDSVDRGSEYHKMAESFSQSRSNPTETHPADGRSYYPAEDRAGYSSESRSAYPADGRAAYPTEGRSAYPTDYRAAYPTDGRSAYPTDDRAAYPTDGRTAYPADERSYYPTEGRAAHPTDDRTAYPTDGRAAYPSNGRSAYPTDGRAAYPTDGRAAYPIDGRAAYPTDGRSAYPSDGRSAYPTDGRSAYPTDGRAAYPTDGRSAYPTDGRAAYPLDERTAYPADGRAAYRTDARSPYPVDGRSYYSTDGGGSSYHTDARVSSPAGGAPYYSPGTGAYDRAYYTADRQQQHRVEKGAFYPAPETSFDGLFDRSGSRSSVFEESLKDIEHYPGETSYSSPEKRPTHLGIQSHVGGRRPTERQAEVGEVPSTGRQAGVGGVRPTERQTYVGDIDSAGRPVDVGAVHPVKRQADAGGVRPRETVTGLLIDDVHIVRRKRNSAIPPRARHLMHDKRTVYRKNSYPTIRRHYILDRKEPFNPLNQGRLDGDIKYSTNQQKLDFDSSNYSTGKSEEYRLQKESIKKTLNGQQDGKMAYPSTKQTSNTAQEPPCDWTLAFQAINGSGRNVYEDYSSMGEMNSGHSKTLVTTNAMLYRDGGILDNWSSLPINKVKMELYSDLELSAWYVFDGKDSILHDWFSKKRLTSSSHGSMNSTEYKFAMKGTSDDVSISFVVSDFYNPCDFACGLAMVVESTTAFSCAYELNVQSYPAFLYGIEPEKCSIFSDSSETGQASRLVISVLMCEIDVESSK